MKKIRTILTGILLILTLSIFTACGNNNAPADEAGTATEENTTDTGTNENADAAIDNGDTMSEGTGNDNVPNNTEDGSVTQDLGDGVRDIGDGVGNAVEDVGDAVGDVIDGDAETR